MYSACVVTQKYQRGAVSWGIVMASTDWSPLFSKVGFVFCVIANPHVDLAINFDGIATDSRDLRLDLLYSCIDITQHGFPSLENRVTPTTIFRKWHWHTAVHRALVSDFLYPTGTIGGMESNIDHQSSRPFGRLNGSSFIFSTVRC